MATKGGNNTNNTKKKEKMSAEEMKKMTLESMKTSDEKADVMVREAEKTLQKWFSSSKYDDAIELLDKAAAQYKLSKNYDAAGRCYLRSATLCEVQTKDSFAASDKYLKAATQYKHIDSEQAMQLYEIAVQMMMDNNRLSTAAKTWKEIGEIFEKEGDITRSLYAWSKAIECFEAEEQNVSAISCIAKVAELHANQEEYKEGMENWERAANKSLESGSSKHMVKDYLFKAILCQLYLSSKENDTMLGTENALERYKEMEAKLEGSRECKFIEDLVAAYKSDDIDQFEKVVFEYDRIYRLDNWTAKVLLAVKKRLLEPEDFDPT